MSVSVGSTMAAQIGVVVVLAQFFGVQGMGEYAFHYAMASFFGLVSVFGFPIYLQRELAACPKEFDRIHSDALSFKLLLDCALLLVALLLPFVFEVPQVWLFYLFVLVRIVMAYNTFFLVEFRVMSAFRTESLLTAAGNLLYFILALLIAYTNRSLIGVAIGLLVAQLLVFFYVIRVWRAKSSKKFLTFTTRNLRQTFKRNLPYALDQGLAEFLGQITSFLIGLFLGTAALGIYQAGLRIANGILALASIVMGAFISKLSEYWSSNRVLFKYESRRAAYLFHVVGICAFLLFWLCGPFITLFLYPPEFEALNELWPLFGLYVASRYFAAAPGLVLVAAGFQRIRVQVNFLAALVILLGARGAIGGFALPGLLWLLIGSCLLTATLYYLTIFRCSVTNAYGNST